MNVKMPVLKRHYTQAPILHLWKNIKTYQETENVNNKPNQISVKENNNK